MASLGTIEEESGELALAAWRRSRAEAIERLAEVAAGSRYRDPQTGADLTEQWAEVQRTIVERMDALIGQYEARLPGGEGATARGGTASGDG